MFKIYGWTLKWWTKRCSNFSFNVAAFAIPEKFIRDTDFYSVKPASLLIFCCSGGFPVYCLMYACASYCNVIVCVCLYVCNCGFSAVGDQTWLKAPKMNRHYNPSMVVDVQRWKLCNTASNISNENMDQGAWKKGGCFISCMICLPVVRDYAIRLNLYGFQLVAAMPWPWGLENGLHTQHKILGIHSRAALHIMTWRDTQNPVININNVLWSGFRLCICVSAWWLHLLGILVHLFVHNKCTWRLRNRHRKTIESSQPPSFYVRFSFPHVLRI